MMTIDEVLDNIASTVGVGGSGNPFMLTASGRAVDLLDPQPDQITLEDACHHLARINRFTGAISRPSYTVGQHLLLATAIAQKFLSGEAAVRYQSAEYWDQLLAVALHDFEEYAFNDLSSPVKRVIGGGDSSYKAAAVYMRKVVYDKFGVDWSYHNKVVQHADLNALVVERYILLPESPHWPRVPAEKLFTRDLPILSTQQVESLLYRLVTDLVAARDLAQDEEDAVSGNRATA